MHLQTALQLHLESQTATNCHLSDGNRACSLLVHGSSQKCTLRGKVEHTVTELASKYASQIGRSAVDKNAVSETGPDLACSLRTSPSPTEQCNHWEELLPGDGLRGWATHTHTHTHIHTHTHTYTHAHTHTYTHTHTITDIRLTLTHT